MKTFKLLISAALVLSLTGCSSEEEIVYEPVAATVTAGINGGLTRAYDNAWEAGDAIGIYSTGNKTTYTNMKYVCDADSKFTHSGGYESGIFFKDASDTQFTAYYPFSDDEKGEGVKPGTDGVITGSTLAQDVESQKNFDYLYAEAVTGNREKPSLDFSFKHMMTRLVLQVQVDGNGFTNDALANVTYKLDGLKHSGSFNTITGETSTDNTVTNDWDFATSVTSSENAKMADPTETKTYNLILFPQKNGQNNASALKFKANVGTEELTCTLTPELEAGSSYTYIITVKKTGLVVSKCTITNWTSGTGGSANAEL